MNRDQFENVHKAEALPTTLSIGEVGTDERTLTYGWHVNGGGTFHVYVKDGLLHAYTYATTMISRGVRQVTNIRHIAGEVLDVEDLRPTKRAYPERTDAHFAMLMNQRDAALPFAPFDDVQFEEFEGNDFHGEVF